MRRVVVAEAERRSSDLASGTKQATTGRERLADL
jgi:hypothetical protein